MVSVNKGAWDKLPGPELGPVRARFEKVHEFNLSWLAACQRVLKPSGSIWVSGTAHVIHSVGFAMQQLGFKLLNDISWVKPNPPPNLSCRYFTHATETIIWAARDKKSRHTSNYKLMKETNRGKQMKSVWEIKPPERCEKRFGKHPTQKPVALLERILLASSHEGDLVLDPFSGSGTTLLAALNAHRSAVGLELSYDFLQLTTQRLTDELIHVELSLTTTHFSLDLVSDSMDRSILCSGGSSDPCFSGWSSGFMPPSSALCSGRSSACPDAGRDRPTARPAPPSVTLSHVSTQLQLVQQECRFYFIGRHNRAVIFCTLAPTLDDAIQKFRSSGHPDSDALFIIKTETSIFLA
jgi:site-specific DNA-methyltransferase (adenine-specific)